MSASPLLRRRGGRLMSALAAAMGLCLPAQAGLAGKWVVYYGNEASYQDFTGYDLVVLDPSNTMEIAPLQARGTEVYGYLSIGEVETYRDHFTWAEEQGLLIEENPNWPGNHIVDVRRQAWREKLIYDVVPELFRRGFDGLFLDTADSPLYLEREQEGFDGMRQAVIRLIRSLDRNFPERGLILNRGYEVLADVAQNLDYALGESVYTTYDFEAEEPRRLDAAAYRRQVELLQNAQQVNPDLTVLTLDYWDPEDTQTVKQIYAEQRAHGFWPYVATVDLQKIVPEPGSGDG